MEKDRLILENIAYFANIVCDATKRLEQSEAGYSYLTVDEKHLFDLRQWLIAYKEWHISNNSTKILG